MALKVFVKSLLIRVNQMHPANHATYLFNAGNFANVVDGVHHSCMTTSKQDDQTVICLKPHRLVVFNQIVRVAIWIKEKKGPRRLQSLICVEPALLVRYPAQYSAGH